MCELALGDVHIFVVVVVGYPYLAWDCLELPFKAKNSQKKESGCQNFLAMKTRSQSRLQSHAKKCQVHCGKSRKGMLCFPWNTYIRVYEGSVSVPPPRLNKVKVPI